MWFFYLTDVSSTFLTVEAFLGRTVLTPLGGRLCAAGAEGRGVLTQCQERKRPSEDLSVKNGEVALLPLGKSSSGEANRQASSQQAEGKEVQQRWAAGNMAVVSLS